MLNLKNIFNVKDYGAKGDGRADDTTSIQKAIDKASAWNGGVVYIPYGTYIVSQLSIKTNVRLTSAKGISSYAKDTRMATLKAKSGASYIITPSGFSSWIIDTIKFDGNLKASSGVTAGGANGVVRDCVFKNCNIAIGLNLGYDWNGYTKTTLYENNTIDKCNGGFRCAVDSKFVYNKLTNITNSAIWMQVADSQICGNYFKNCGRGINGNGYAYGNHNAIEDNILIDIQYPAIDFDSTCYLNTVTNNQFYSCGSSSTASVVIGGSGNVIFNNIIGKGTIDIADYGIYVTQNSNSVVAQNDIQSYNVDKIYDDGNSTGLTIVETDYENYNMDAKHLSKDLSLYTWNNTVVNVKDYGAKGDGSTNDTVAIQNAIDSLPNGGIVHFQSGNYLIDGLTMRDHVALTSFNQSKQYSSTYNSTTLTASTSATFMINTNNSKYMVLQGLNISGGTNIPNIIGGGSNILMDSCRVNKGTYGVSGGDKTFNKLLFTNSTVNACEVSITDVIHSTIENNFFLGSNTVVALNKNNNLLINNKIEWNTKTDGKGTVITGDNNVVKGNIYDVNTVVNIEVNGGNNNLIIGNYFRRTGAITDTSKYYAGSHVYIKGTNNLRLIGNTFSKESCTDDGTGDIVPNYGIFLEGDSTIIAKGNLITGIVASAVYKNTTNIIDETTNRLPYGTIIL